MIRADLPPSVLPTHPDYTRDRYTLAHAAEYLAVSPKFLYALVAAKRIDHARWSTAKNAKVIFNQAALDRYAASRRHPAMTTDMRPRLMKSASRSHWKIAQ